MPASLTLRPALRSTHPRVIGIAGRARSGKDTVAEILLSLTVAHYRYSFADPIRAMLLAGFGVDMANPEWQSRKEEPAPELLGKSPRFIMQTLGTEWGRDIIAADLWLQLGARRLDRTPGQTMVIADVRFANEAKWVRQHGVLIHLRNPRTPRIRQHSSEVGVRPAKGDLRLVNDGTLDVLRQRTSALFIPQR